MSNVINVNLNTYIAGILKKVEIPALIIHSVDDHIHMLFRLFKRITVAKISLWQAYSLLLGIGLLSDLGRLPQALFYQAFGLGIPSHD